MEAKEIYNVVAGEPVSGVRTFEDVNPVTGEVHALVHEAGRDVVDRAVEAARNAMNGEWGTWAVPQRVALLRRIADLIDERAEEFVAAEIADTGKPVSLVQELDVMRAAMNFRSFADTLSNVPLDAFLSEPATGGSALNYAVRRPLGVIAVVVPWNLPLLLLTWKVAPALACGNAVVAKPSEETPATATLLAEIIADAGAPAGVYNVVHGFGPDSAGALLTSHPGIDAITFTGETRTGSAIMKAAADHVVPVSFELGGKNPALVFADCDIEATLDGLTRSAFLNTGQVCLCTERIYVERPIFDQIVAGLAERARELRMGQPKDEATTTGPLISQEHREKVLGYYELAREEGGTIVVGGGVPEMPEELSGGWWVEPTVITGLDNSARLMREEVFGPITALVPFDTEDEAIALANDTDYGLAASVWTKDLQRGHRVAQKLEVGMAWVNTWYKRDLRSPFGGVGRSGIGREGGMHSLNFYSEPTNVCVQL
ncbi:2-hydroxymuconic semialdehyde dehydrogenase [Enemella sp. A6]|uniref:2-hydroxymuconic semialdehyde dehydrogenase n=1 Tax=Enemella sp. A6 TaxID=3440152 RepID=UPI003EC0D96B